MRLNSAILIVLLAYAGCVVAGPQRVVPWVELDPAE